VETNELQGRGTSTHFGRVDFKDGMSTGDCDRPRLAVRHYRLFRHRDSLCICILVSFEISSGENIVLGAIIINIARFNGRLSWR
jgi:hypothetical protein